MKADTKPAFLLAATTWWALSARLASDLLRNGCRVETLCPPGSPLRHVKGVSRHHLYSSFKSLETLQKTICEVDPELIIPCDDGVVRQLHQLYDCRPALRTLIEHSLGAPQSFGVVCNRHQLQELAEQLNIRVPRASRIRSVDDLQPWFGEARRGAVLKQDGTWGGSGVRVVHTLAEAASELRRMLRPTPWSRVLKRLVVDRDPLALWSRRHGAPLVTLQEYIPGRPANLMMACWKGEVLGTVTVEVLWSQGPTGAAMVVRLIQNSEIGLAAHKLAATLELSGFFGLDFVLESKSGAAHLIEMNPRCTQLGHLNISGKGSLAGVLCKKLGLAPHGSSHANHQSTLSVGDTVAFFPRAFSHDQPRYLDATHQDIPAHDPGLVRELLKQDWPDRQWPARLYHCVRPRSIQPPTGFAAAPEDERNPEPVAAQENQHDNADCARSAYSAH